MLNPPLNSVKCNSEIELSGYIYFVKLFILFNRIILKIYKKELFQPNIMKGIQKKKNVKNITLALWHCAGIKTKNVSFSECEILSN